MDRLISEQYLIEHLKACFENGRPMYRPTLDEVSEMIKVIPSAEPKTGHWIKTISENGVTSAARCSKCGFEDNRYMLFRYCPNCGARMVEQESEDKE